MRTDIWPHLPIALGLFLLAAAAADGNAMMMSDRDDWWLLVRTELTLLGGLWLLCGFNPRWIRFLALVVLGGIAAGDLARAMLGVPPRDIFAHVATGTAWVLVSDLIVFAGLLRWRAMNRPSWIDAHPVRLAVLALVAVSLGAAIDRMQIGRYPFTATARSGGTSSSPGLDYLVYLPEGYRSSSRCWPLILDLHGAGEWGRDVERVRTAGLPRRIEAGLRLPFVVVAPQSPQHGWDPTPLDALLEEVLRLYRIDADRVYLTGSSMGGYGVWTMATAHPERFAAIAPICGGGDPTQADRLRNVPTWAFHGADDTIIPAAESRAMVAAQERAGGEVRLTIYPGVGHGAATPTYTDRKLYDWFLAHRRIVGGPKPK